MNKFTCRIAKYDNVTGPIYKGHIPRGKAKVLGFDELVFNSRALSFRQALLHDTKTTKVSVEGVFYISRNSTNDLDEIVGDYLVEQEGDIYFLVKVDPFEYVQSSGKNSRSISVS
jgi:hypothetical protein